MFRSAPARLAARLRRLLPRRRSAVVAVHPHLLSSSSRLPPCRRPRIGCDSRCPRRVRCGSAILTVVVFLPSSSCRSSASASPINDSASPISDSTSSGSPLHHLPAVPHQIQRPPASASSTSALPRIPCLSLPLPSVSISDRNAPPLQLRLPAVPVIPAPPGPPLQLYVSTQLVTV
ncbi:hypothetical protein ACLOJK_024900 [Asimina triloba]